MSEFHRDRFLRQGPEGPDELPLVPADGRFIFHDFDHGGSFFRSLLIQTFAETRDRAGKDEDAEEGQGRVLGPEDLQARPLEKDAARRTGEK
jgi:hypothetical protein